MVKKGSLKLFAAVLIGALSIASVSLSTYALVQSNTNRQQEGPQGEKGDPGLNGEDGRDGEDGKGVVSIGKTSSSGNVDTYTIAYSDGTTSTFTVTNGKDGAQGIQGEPGEDGHTPIITIGENGNWFVDGADTGISATGAQGPQGEAGKDGEDGVGISSIELTNSDGRQDTYTIYYTDGTSSSFVVTNGEDGEQGIQGIPGEDGHTPVITISSDGYWVVDGVKTNTKTQGEQGEPGKDGTSLLTGHGCPSNSSGKEGDSYIDLDTWNFYVKKSETWNYEGNIKGEQGNPGKDGQDGTNGVDGIDGTSVLTGEGAPDADSGKNGDSYIDLLSWDYYVKANGKWELKGNIKGSDGEQGIQGEPGEDGHTPVITIGENGNWYIDGEDTGVLAEGAQGSQGDPGQDGQDGHDGITPHIGENGNWYIGDQDTGVSASGYINKTYQITFFPNGGTLPEDFTMTMEVHSGHYIHDLPVPTKAGYRFLGWFTGNGVNDGQFTTTTPVFSDMNLIARWEEGESIVEDEPILISTPSELASIRNYPSGKYRLANDISLDGIQWEPIGTEENPFCGTLDGGDHSITNFNSIVNGHDVNGIFGFVSNANFENIVVENVALDFQDDTEKSIFGSLIGSGENVQLKNISVDGLSISTKKNGIVGGIVGETSGTSQLTQCGSLGILDVTNGDYVGGLIGVNQGELKVEGCNSEGEFRIHANSSDFSFAGILGATNQDVNCSISNTINRKSIVVTGYLDRGQTAGFVGTSLGYISQNRETIDFRSCENYGDITISSIIDNLIYVAGFFGGESNSSVSCSNCANYGDITVEDDSKVSGVVASGFVGGDCEGISLSTCENTGNISIEEVEAFLLGQAYGGSSGYAGSFLINDFEGHGNINATELSRTRSGAASCLGSLAGLVETTNLNLQNITCDGQISLSYFQDTIYSYPTDPVYISGLAGIILEGNGSIKECQVTNHIVFNKNNRRLGYGENDVICGGFYIANGSNEATYRLDMNQLNINGEISILNASSSIAMAKCACYTSGISISSSSIDDSNLVFSRNGEDITSSVGRNKLITY